MALSAGMPAPIFRGFPVPSIGPGWEPGAFVSSRVQPTISSPTCPVCGTARGRSREGEDVAAEAQALQIWSPSLPCPPENLLGEVRFRLRSEEAAFIIDRLVSAQPRSLLTFLARSGAGSADCANIWEHPHLADFPNETRTLVGHSEVFSSVMHGAALLYNLLLSRLRENPDWIEKV